MALLRAAPVERARPALVLEAHGPPRNRIHYIIVGDGYTEADLETKYVEHLEAMLESRFTAEYESARPIDSSTPAAMASGELDDHGAVMRRGLIGGALVRIAVMAFGWRAVAPVNAPVVPEDARRSRSAPWYRTKRGNRPHTPSRRDSTRAVLPPALGPAARACEVG